MTVAEWFILFGCLLQGAQGSEFSATMPKSIKALSESCVLIPCTFDFPSEYNKYMTLRARGLWKRGGHSGDVIFDSSKSDEKNKIAGKLDGKVHKKNCTTVLDNFSSSYNGTYFFRVENPHKLKFNTEPGVQINAQASPPKPSLSHVELKVKEGTLVSLKCSAAAPCPKLPPNLTWTPSWGDSVDQLQENEDKTKYVSSVLNFTASHHHHERKITCTALYTLQQGGSQKKSEASLTPMVLYPPKNTTVSISPSRSVFVGSTVTLFCSSKANPPVQTYTWYKEKRTEMTTVRTGETLMVNVTESSHSEQYYCEARNEHGKENSTSVQLDILYPPKNTTVSISPSRSVVVGSTVTLFCSSKANPPVQTYTWYKEKRTEMTTVRTGETLMVNVTESSHSEQYYCEARNEHGKENSTSVQLDILYMPQISGSGSCNRTAAQISCFCETHGNPSPSMEWHVSGLQVTNSTDRVIREERLGNTGLRSSLTMNHSQGVTPTLLCLSTNIVGSSTLQLYITSLQQSQDCFSTLTLLIGGLGVALMISLLWCLVLFLKQNWRMLEKICANDLQEVPARNPMEKQTNPAPIQDELKPASGPPLKPIQDLCVNHPMVARTQKQEGKDILHYATLKFTACKTDKAPPAANSPIYDNVLRDESRKY